VCRPALGQPTSRGSLHDIFTTAYRKLTQQEILEWWPSEEEKPDRKTLARWLARAVQQKAICSEGAGHRGNPTRYWLAEREPLLFPGDGAAQAAIDAWKAKCEAETRERLLGALGKMAGTDSNPSC